MPPTPGACARQQNASGRGAVWAGQWAWTRAAGRALEPLKNFSNMVRGLGVDRATRVGVEGWGGGGLWAKGGVGGWAWRVGGGGCGGGVGGGSGRGAVMREHGTRVCQHSVRTLVVTTDGSPIAVQNRTHALLDAELVSPVVKRMAACHTLYVNGVDEFTVQVICLAAALYKQEGITDDNAFQIEFQDGDMDDVRVLAMGIKRCVAYVRKLFVRQHTPKDHSDGN